MTWKRHRRICSSRFKLNGNAINTTSTIRFVASLLLILSSSSALAADYPPPVETDYTVRDFKFASGENLPELRIHYRTLGKIDKDDQGKRPKELLNKRGPTGNVGHLIGQELEDHVIAKDRPLDATTITIGPPD